MEIVGNGEVHIMDMIHDVGATRQYGTVIDHLVDKAEEIDFPHSRYATVSLYEKSVSGKKGFPSQDRKLGISAFFRPRGRSTRARLAEVIVILVSGRVAESRVKNTGRSVFLLVLNEFRGVGSSSMMLQGAWTAAK